MDQFCGSKFWDADITWNTTNPDFTPCFERTVLGLVPCLYLCIFCILDIYLSYTSTSREIPWSPLSLAKLGMTSALVALETGFIVVYRIILTVSYPVDLYVPAIRATTIILSAVLLLYSKAKGVRSSGVQFIFWFLFSLTQAIRFRTVITKSGDNEDPMYALDPIVYVMEIVYFPVVLGQLFLHCWSDVAPIYQQNDYEVKSKNTCPEQSASFLSRVIFEWFTSFAWKGFKKPLEVPDLWPLNYEDLSRNIVPIFDRHWPGDLNRGADKKEAIFVSPKCQQSNGTVSHSLESTSEKSEKKELRLFRTILNCFGVQYFTGFFLRSFTDITLFISPLVLSLLINFADSDEPQWKGILYAVILFTCAFIGTLFNTSGNYLFYLSGMRAKSALISAVYRKSLLLSNSAKRAESMGEISNHMAVDIQHITDVVQFSYQMFSSPVIMAVALYFLWTILGPSALAGVVVMLICLPVNGYLASKLRTLHREQMLNKDKRIKLMNEILNGIKVLKLYAWEPSFENQVMKIRKGEIGILKKIAYLTAFSNFLWMCSPFLVAICSFGSYVFSDSSHVLDANTAFVSLALFNFMSHPLSFLPLLIAGFVRASVAMNRLNKYMNAEELLDQITKDNEENPVVIENASFKWEEDGMETLKNIDFVAKDGELVAIVGVVGCGKSSLLSALLNELIMKTGRANVRGSVAYVAQQSWIQNATLRYSEIFKVPSAPDNVLFGKPFDARKYDKVIEACALKPDLEMLPAGDKTEIGEKGINLSGGQKARVALARAVYSNADVYLMDDPLSAVDAHVGKHIFEKVLGPNGCLRRKTRLLVTHGVIYLPHMDNIYVMSNGRISEFGTYHQLLNKQGQFSEFLKQHLKTGNTEELEGTELEDDLKNVLRDLAPIKSLRKRLVSESESEFSNAESVSGRMTRHPGSVTSLNEQRKTSRASLEKDKLIEEEKAEKDGVKTSVYLDYIRAAGWGTVATTLGLYVVFQGFSVSANMWLSEWTNLPIINGTQDADQRNFYIGIYGALGSLQAISILFGTMAMALGAVTSANVLHLEMLKRVLRAPLAFFDVTPIGRIINRFTKDIDSMDTILPLYLRHLLNSIFNVIAVIVVISVSTPIFTAVIVPVGFLYYLVQRFYVATSRQLKRLESVTKSPIYSHFGETLSGASTIRAFNQQERFILESEQRVDLNLMTSFASICANRWLQVRLETLGSAVVFFAALFAVLGRETLSAGIVGLSVSYALQVTSALILVVQLTSDVETNIVAVERLKEYSEIPQEAPWEVRLCKPNKLWPEAGEIVFNQYKTRYRPGLDLVLKNVTCAIKPGEKVGIVGRTGAGKSSMTLAIFRIVEAAGGSITIDGKDISRLGLHDLRGRITIIPQDPVLFSGTLRINLDPFETQSDETLYHALELAHLRNFVSTLPGGLDYEIAEGGENLSVGQRQLVCLARALLRKTKILVLDEATAAVDLDTDDLIQRTIKKEFNDSTIITIAHRLNTIMDSDRVIVLDKGEIREFDAPQKLLVDGNSIFSSMASEAGITNQSMKIMSTENVE